MAGTPRISYARSPDGVSLAFTITGDGPAVVFVPWVPFSNLRMEWQNPFLNRVFEQMARRLQLCLNAARTRARRAQRPAHPSATTTPPPRPSC